MCLCFIPYLAANGALEYVTHIMARTGQLNCENQKKWQLVRGYGDKIEKYFHMRPPVKL